MALPKKIAWPIIIFALFWDGFLTVRAGGEGNRYPLPNFSGN